MPLLQVKNLSISFRKGEKKLSVVQNVSFDIARGEIIALVGESGCGKSVTCLSLTKLLPSPPAEYSQGSIIFEYDDKQWPILSLRERELRRIRGGKIAYIFQEPSVSLNPVFKVGEQIAESVLLHRKNIDNIDKIVLGLLEDVGIPDPVARAHCYPHELSGGMQQRIMIAMALAGNPELLIADEPTTALDVTIQAQILDLLRKLQRQRAMSIILVTHNLGLVAEVADRVMVMYAGHNIELATTDELINRPRHPYTRALLNAVPQLNRPDKELISIPGNIPTPEHFPAGCRFHGRCQKWTTLTAEEQERCATLVPDWQEIDEGHFCRCFYPVTS